MPCTAPDRLAAALSHPQPALVGRMGPLVGKAGAEGSNKAPVSERFNYQFEQPQTPEGSESEYGG
ncbi:hypothetical protein ACWD25_45350 [Streptomyces sp. NPDC002920]